MSIATPPTYLPNDPRQPAGTPTDPAANLGQLVTCAECGVKYRVARLRPDRPSHRCISCRGKHGRAESHKSYSTPESTKAERIRANGLVNKRLRLGWFEKPKTCCLCGLPHHRITGHHADYAKADHVHWVCPPCHLRIHHNPSLLAGIEPFVCYDRRAAEQKPKPHGRGGRPGPMDYESLALLREAKANKITPAQVEEMRRRSDAGERHADIAPDYGIAKSTVGRLLRGVTLPGGADALPASPARSEVAK